MHTPQFLLQVSHIDVCKRVTKEVSYSTPKSKHLNMKSFSVYSERNCDLDVWSAVRLQKPACDLDNSIDTDGLTNPHIWVNDASALFSDGIWVGELTLPHWGSLMPSSSASVTVRLIHVSNNHGYHGHVKPWPCTQILIRIHFLCEDSMERTDFGKRKNINEKE